MKKLLLIPLVLAFVACSTNNAPELPGVFSVGRNWKVQFSPGVLKYKASTNTWRFADSQLDVIGEGNMNISSTYNGWIDLFGYGCTGYNDKFPWQYSDNPADYAPSRTEGITCSEYDWGTYCDIQNGGEKGSWHLMNSGNWYYLLQKRPNAYNLATFLYIEDMYGLVIFPDDWQNTTDIVICFPESPSDDRFENGIYGSIELIEKNHFSKNQWKKLEKTGAVFLPAVGWRIGQNMSYHTDGTQGPRGYRETSYYWCGNITFEGAEPWTLKVEYRAALYQETSYFAKGKGGELSYANRGFFVRLVKDVK